MNKGFIRFFTALLCLGLCLPGTGFAKAAPASHKQQSRAKVQTQAKSEKKSKKSKRKQAESTPQAPLAPSPDKTPTAKSGLEPQKSQAAGERLPANIWLNVKAAIVMDQQTGQVVYEQDADKPIAPASITKLLTLFLIYEAIDNGQVTPWQNIPISAEANRQSGSRMTLRTGQEVPLAELIKGISIASANNACYAVAEYLGKGDAETFVKAMNEKAKSLGMTGSQFKNPNGLPDEAQFSTARDIMILSREYLKRYPGSISIHSMQSFTYNNRTKHNSNPLLGRCDGVDGLKTGFVCSSGYNIAITAKRGDTRIIGVVLGARSHGVRERESRKLVEYGFKLSAYARQNSSKVVASAK